MIEQNLIDVRGRIDGACRRCGREPASVTLIAVSKTFGAEAIRTAQEAGIRDFGENYIQELRGKRDALPDPGIRWHFIGHLQTNKVKYIADWVHLVHSVDSVRLARALSSAGEKIGRDISALVEVNTTAEESKFGVSPGETPDFVREIAALPRLKIEGLMTMGPMSENPEDSRAAFRTLAGLGARIRSGGPDMVHLSMGMTGDFEVAIEEGATLIRVGTAIFGPRDSRAGTQVKGGD